jgi:hypothetical protein
MATNKGTGTYRFSGLVSIGMNHIGDDKANLSGLEIFVNLIE